MAEYHFPVAGYRGKVQHHHGSHKGGSDLFAPAGTPVLAMGDAEVVDAGFSKVGGYHVTLRGQDGLTYYYAHLQEPPPVKKGQRVRGGTQVGKVGDTGNAKGTGAHLHIGIGRSIQSGVGPAGGTGTDFDAVSFLSQAQRGQPATQRGAAVPPTKKTTRTTTKTVPPTTGSKGALEGLLAQRKREAEILHKQIETLSTPGTPEDETDEGKAAKQRREALLNLRRQELRSIETAIRGLEKDVLTASAGSPGGTQTEVVETETDADTEPTRLQTITDKNGRVWAFNPLTGERTDLGLGSRGSQERTPEELDDSARGWANIENQREQTAIALMRAGLEAGELDFKQATDFLDRIEKMPATVSVGGKTYVGGLEPGGLAATISKKHGLPFAPTEFNAVDVAGAIGRPDLNQHLISGPHKDRLDAAGIPTGKAAAGIVPRSPLNDMVRQQHEHQEPVAQQPMAAEEPLPAPSRGLQPAPAPQLPQVGMHYDPLTKTMGPPPAPPVPDTDAIAPAMRPIPQSPLPVAAGFSPADIAANSPDASQFGVPAPIRAPVMAGPMLGAPVMPPEVQELVAQGWSPDEAFRKIAGMTGWR
ncbi:MAG TPA: peptidoglycan DD-metalloendopeptidase family protein [Acidimicrobiales bacterium]|nr:peptidoglycan DD-metalloendopeptidase family protein [Acidimicrobiales bacterium]